MRHLTGARHFFLPSRILTLVAALMLLLAACGDDDNNPAATAGAPTAAGAAAAAEPTAPPAPPAPPTKVTFMAGFKPQANLPFVGVYVAQEQGFFAEQNLEVEIRHAQQGEHLQLLAAGQVQFTTANAASLLLRRADPGLDIVSIALIGQKGEQGFAVLSDAGIATPRDWAGKTFGYKGSVPPEFLAVAEANDLDPASVEQVRVGFDPRILSEGQVDILAVFISNEPDTLAKLGFPTTVFDPNDYGIPALGLTYMTTGEYIAAEPETVERFLKAVLKGLEYAAANPEAALDIVMAYAPDEDRAHQQYMLGIELERALAGEAAAHGIGWQTAAQWQALEESLVKYGALAEPLDVSGAFTDTFLQRIYRDGVLVWP
jgi:ABC-type nitrate/sulfonate/bicarbonate transport system substrate-binding protein